MSTAHRSSRVLLLLLLGGLIAVLPACGNKSDSSGAGAKGAPVSARVQGAESPEALVARLKRSTDAEDFADLVACIAPTDRALLSASMVIMAQLMPMFLGMAVAFAPDDAAKKEAEGKMAAMKDEIDSVLARHGLTKMIERMSGEAPPEMGEGDEREKAEALRKMLEEAAPNLDHGALIADVFATLSKMGDGDGSTTTKTNKFVDPLTDLQIDGDTAAGMLGGEPIKFVRVDGRWYLSGDTFLNDK